MNPHQDPPQGDELDLRRRLRQLARERAPQRDLWSGIQARLDPVSLRRAPRTTRRRGGYALAAAASVLLALIVLLRPAAPPDPTLTGAAAPPQAGPTPPASLRLEADALTIEYRTALDGFAAAPLPPAVQAAASELDHSADQLREALRAQPDATYLLDRLRHTYDQRLKLTQRAQLG
jgi:hypothetical protein